MGAKVSLDHFVSVFSALLSFAGLVLVVIQFRRATTQREAESLIKIYDTNRELLSLGFAHPQLFAILKDAENVDPVLQSRYLQLWLNHLSLLHLYLSRSVFDAELKESEAHALAEFMTHKNMQRHWKEKSAFYPASFQKRVNAIIEKGEPLDTAHDDLSTKNLPGDLLESRARQSHEVFPLRRDEHGRGFPVGNETLNEHVTVVGDDGSRTRAAVAQLGELPILPDNCLDRHGNGIFEFLRSLKQNHAFCFTYVHRGAFV